MNFLITLHPKRAPVYNTVAMEPIVLAKRWGISVRTLSRWRNKCVGPTYMMINAKKCLYRLNDIKVFESTHCC